MPIKLYFGNEEILAAINGGGAPTTTTTTTTTTTSTTTTTTTIAYVTSGLVVNLDNAPQTGAVWYDSSGNNNDFDIVGSPSRTTDYGGGIIIASNTQAMYDSSFNISSAFTVEMVVYPNISGPYWAVLWGNESWTAQKGFFAYWGDPNVIRFNRPQQDPGLSTSATMNALAQYVFTYNGTSRIYRNGSQIASTSVSAPGAADSGFTIAIRHTNAGVIPSAPFGDHAPGTYYLMRVYNRALTSGEVTTNYNAISSRFGI